MEEVERAPPVRSVCRAAELPGAAEISDAAKRVCMFSFPLSQLMRREGRKRGMEGGVQTELHHPKVKEQTEQSQEELKDSWLHLKRLRLPGK